MKKIQKKKRQPKSEIAKSKSKQSHVLPVRAGRPSAEDVCGSDDRFVQLFFRHSRFGARPGRSSQTNFSSTLTISTYELLNFYHGQHYHRGRQR